MKSDPAPASAPSRLTVYYNSACPVCDAGICYQRERMQDAAVTWVDVHAEPGRAQDTGTGLEAVRERLHVRDRHGTLHVGDQAFAALLAHTPGQRWLAWFPRHVSWLTAPLYNGLAKLLYRWNRRRGHW